MMGWYGGAMSPREWLATGVTWLFLLWLIVWLLAWLLPGGGIDTTRTTGESPVEILDNQLVAGEIDLTAWHAQRAALMAPVADSTDRSRDIS
jgi:hypothetical protein